MYLRFFSRGPTPLVKASAFPMTKEFIRGLMDPKIQHWLTKEELKLLSELKQQFKHPTDVLLVDASTLLREAPNLAVPLPLLEKIDMRVLSSKALSKTFYRKGTYFGYSVVDVTVNDLIQRLTFSYAQKIDTLIRKGKTRGIKLSEWSFDLDALEHIEKSVKKELTHEELNASLQQAAKISQMKMMSWRMKTGTFPDPGVVNSVGTPLEWIFL